MGKGFRSPYLALDPFRGAGRSGGLPGLVGRPRLEKKTTTRPEGRRRSSLERI